VLYDAINRNISKNMVSPQQIHEISQNSDFWAIQLQITQKPDVLGKFCGQLRFQRQNLSASPTLLSVPDKRSSFKIQVCVINEILSVLMLH